MAKHQRKGQEAASESDNDTPISKRTRGKATIKVRENKASLLRKVPSPINQSTSGNDGTSHIRMSSPPLLAGEVCDSGSPRPATSECGTQTPPHTCESGLVSALNPSAPDPLLNSRLGLELHLVLPHSGPIHCTEGGCIKMFAVPDFHAASETVMAHLRDHHQLEVRTLRTWCSICLQSCDAQPLSHACFDDNEAYEVPPHAIVGLSIECPTCFYATGSETQFEVHTKYFCNAADKYGESAMTIPGAVSPVMRSQYGSPASSTCDSATNAPAAQYATMDDLHLTSDSDSPNLPEPVPNPNPCLGDLDLEALGQQLLDQLSLPVQPEPVESNPSTPTPIACSPRLLFSQVNSPASSLQTPVSDQSSVCERPEDSPPLVSLHINDSEDSLLDFLEPPPPARPVPAKRRARPSTEQSTNPAPVPAVRRRRPNLNNETRPDTSPTNANQPSTPATGPNARRDGQTLNFFFPINAHLKCTEPGCNSEFVQDGWWGEKQSLIRHLVDMHGVTPNAVKRWCRICDGQTPSKVSAHPCLRGVRLFQPNMLTTYKYQCRRCDKSFPSRGGIRNHARNHRIADARNNANAQRSTPTTQVATNTNRTQQAVTRNSPTAGNHESESSAPSTPNPESQYEEGTLPEPLTANDEEGDVDVADDPDDVINAAERGDPANADEPSPSKEFTRKFRSLLALSPSDVNWGSFIRLLDDYIDFAKNHCKIPPPRPATGNRDLNTRNPKAMQRMYRFNRRRTMRKILQEEGANCTIEHEQLAAHFCPPKQPEPPEEAFVHPQPASEPPYSQRFTPEEVWGKLKSAENSAPGPDRITYLHWRSVDPEAKTLAEIFSFCVKYKRVPESWKVSTTILLPKDGEPDCPSSWRPIALSNTIIKLFTGCIARRLTTWIEEHSILSPAQKGFMPFDGAFEHTYLLNALVQRARTHKEELCVASLDISNAFGSIPHAGIFAALREAGVGQVMLDIVRDLYSCNTTRFLSDNGPSPQYSIHAGVKQGCPLSGLLFNITVDPVLRALQNDGPDTNVLAFADDLLIIAKTPAELQARLNKAWNTCSLIGLTLNPRKCVSFHLGHNPTGCKATKFQLGETTIRFLNDGEEAKFLGKAFGFSLVKDPTHITEFAEVAKSILTSCLAPWQKLDAMKAFFYPALNYALRTAQFSKSEWDSLDRSIRPLLKDTLNIHSRGSNNYLYGHQDHGLFGIPQTAEDCDIAAVDAAMKLLTTNDDRLKEFAWNDLIETFTARCRSDPSDEDLMNYLSGTHLPSSNRISNVWTRARKASEHLKIRWRIFHDRSVAITCQGKVTIDRRKVFKELRNLFKTNRSTDLGKMAHQGKTFHSFSKSKSSSHFNRTGDYIRFADWRFIHRARLGLTPLNGYTFNPTKSKACRRCACTNETLPHVVCHCPPLLPLATKRHNEIVNRVKTAAHANWTVYKENQALPGTTLRPDLVLTRGDSALIIDVAVTFENGADAFPKIRHIKETKYAPLIDLLQDRYSDVRVEAVVVGALGSWDRQNDRVINRLCSRKYAKTMRKLIVSDTIRASRDMYTQHITGVPQTQDSRYAQYNRPTATISREVTTVRNDSRTYAAVAAHQPDNGTRGAISASPNSAPAPDQGTCVRAKRGDNGQLAHSVPARAAAIA